MRSLLKRLAWALSKKRLAEQFAEYPLLRLILFKFWFRVAVAGFLFLVLLLGLMLPKIWTTSPPGFLPVVKVRGLDLLQAWSLRRHAVKAQAAGRVEEALLAWQAAVAYNPADLDLLRGLLQAIPTTVKPKALSELAIIQTRWLLRLSSTNQADVELAARVYEKCELDELVLQILAPQEEALGPVTEFLFVKALFRQGQMEFFKKHIERAKKQFEADPELRLYQAAYRAGWGSPQEKVEGRQQLEAAQQAPGTQKLAHHLQLAVSWHLADAARYDQALQKLVELRDDTPIDEVNYWRLLATAGQKSEAIQRAQRYPFAPATARETIELVKGYKELGRRDQARELLQRYASQYGYMEALWFLYADVLLEDRNWDGLTSLALKIREEGFLRERLAGYSYYLEGLAEVRRQRRSRAEEAFGKAGEAGFENLGLGVFVARDMMQMGYPVQAKTILAKLEKPLSQNLEYWRLVFDNAYALKDPELALSAAARAYQLQPKEPLLVNNYAAGLLTLRRRPDEAVRLTLQLLLQSPNSSAAKINHSLALLQNHRLQEAETLLKKIDSAKLQANEANAYYQAMLELHLDLKQYEQARAIIGRIDTNPLFPVELQWLEQVKKQIAIPPGQ